MCLLFLCLGLLSCSAASHRSFVCITGQLSRLELQSKVKYFFEPNVAAGVQMDVNFVLSPTLRQITNRRSGGLGWRSHELGDVVQAIESLGIDVDVDLREQTRNPPLNAAYMKQLDKPDMRDDERAVRVQNHYRQWEALSRCWEGVRGGMQYDSYTRLRDDSLFWSPMILTQFEGPPGVHVPHCNSWWGVNDRGAVIIGSVFARAYFVQLLAHWNRSLENNVVNPESYLASVLQKEGIPIHIECGYFLTFMSSHINRKNETCTTWNDRGDSPPSRHDRCVPKLPNFCAPHGATITPLCNG